MVFTSNYVSAHETNSTKAPLSRRTTRNHQFPLRNTITSNSNRKRKAAVENEPKPFPSKRARFYGSYFLQKWSLPDSIIYYINKNPSTSKCYQKMIQSCKYFFIKNPILVVSHLYFQFQENVPNICFNGKRIIDFKIVTSKIWISNKFAIDIKNSSESNPFSSIFPKIYLSNIKKITLYNQNILFNEFILYTSSKCDYIFFKNAFVINENGSFVVLEKVIQILPNIKYFCHENNVTSDIFSSITVQELLKISHFSNITDFSISNISEDFDIELFHAFIKKNKKTRSDLSFDNEISEVYKSRLQTIVNEIITTNYHDYKIPYIRFLGMSQTSASILYKLCRKRIY